MDAAAPIVLSGPAGEVLGTLASLGVGYAAKLVADHLAAKRSARDATALKTLDDATAWRGELWKEIERLRRDLADCHDALRRSAR